MMGAREALWMVVRAHMLRTRLMSGAFLLMHVCRYIRRASAHVGRKGVSYMCLSASVTSPVSREIQAVTSRIACRVHACARSPPDKNESLTPHLCITFMCMG